MKMEFFKDQVIDESLFLKLPNAAESCNQMSGAASIDCDGSFQLRWTDIFVKKQRPGS